MEALKLILNFLLEMMKMCIALIQDSQKEDALTIEKNGTSSRIVIPKSIITGVFAGFFGVLSYLIIKLM